MSTFTQINDFHLPCQTDSAQLQALLLPEHTEHPFRPPGHQIFYTSVTVFIKLKMILQSTVIKKM